MATPTIDDLIWPGRKRPGKKPSNEDWTSPTDADAKIARMKDGTTHLAFKRRRSFLPFVRRRERASCFLHGGRQ